MWGRLIALALFLGIALAAWELVSQSRIEWQMILPAPSRVFLRMIERSDRLVLHAGITFGEMAGGLALAVLAAFPLAWLMVRWQRLRFILQPVLVLTQAVPMFALAPIMVIWFDWSYTAVVVPTALMIFFPLTVTTFQGLISTPEPMVDYFKLHGATEWQTLTKLRLPWALPHICSGLRIAAAIAGVGALAGEWAGAQEGLGVLMLESRRGADLELTFAALFCLSLLTLLFYGGMVGVEKMLRQPSSFATLKRLLARPAMVFLALLLLACGRRADDEQTLRLMLDWLPNPNHVPLYVGVEKGFFREAGTPLKILKMQDPADGCPYVMAGQADLALTYMPHLVKLCSRGADLQAVGYLIKQPLNSFIFRKDPTVTKPSDLSGRVFSYTTDAMLGTMLDRLLAFRSVEPSARRKVGFDLVSALATGKVDVIYGAYWNIEREQLRSFGIETQYFSVADFGMPRYFELLVASSGGMLKKYPEFVEAFKRGLQRSIDFCRANPDEAFAIYLAANPDKGPVTQQWERRAWAVTYPLLALDQDDEQEVWQRYLDWVEEHQILQDGKDGKNNTDLTGWVGLMTG